MQAGHHILYRGHLDSSGRPIIAVVEKRNYVFIDHDKVVVLISERRFFDLECKYFGCRFQLLRSYRFSRHFPLSCHSLIRAPNLMIISPFVLFFSYILLQLSIRGDGIGSKSMYVMF